MAENAEQTERRWKEVQQHAEIVRQVHPARRLDSERDMLWLVEEVERLRRENARLSSLAEEGDQGPSVRPRAA